MMTLNGGFSVARGDGLQKEDRELIEEYMKTHAVTKLQPAGLDGNEASRGTKERIAKLRREFRSKNKKQKV